MADAEKEILEFESRGLDEQIALLDRRNAALDENAASGDRLAASSDKLASSLDRQARAEAEIVTKLRESNSAAGEAFRKTEDQARAAGELATKLELQQRQQELLADRLRETSNAYGVLSPQTEAMAEAYNELSAEIQQTEADLQAAVDTVASYAEELDAAIAADEDFAAAASELEGALSEVDTAAEDAAAGVQRVGEESETASEQAGGLATNIDQVFGALSQLPGPVGAVSGQLGQMFNQATSVGEAFSVLPGKLALLAGGAAVLIGLAAGFAASVQETQQYAIAVSRISATTGESIEFVSGLAEAADDASISLTGQGKSIDEVGGAIQRFNALIGRGIDENGEFTEANARTLQALKELGVTAEDSNGKLKPLQQLLPDIADGFQRLGPGAQSTSLAKQLGLTDLLPLLLQGRDAFKDLNSVISSEGVESVKRYAEQVDGLEDKWRDFKVNVGTDVLPFLTKLLDAANLRSERYNEGGFSISRGLETTPLGAMIALIRDVASSGDIDEAAESTADLAKAADMASSANIAAGYQAQSRALQEIADASRLAQAAEFERLTGMQDYLAARRAGGPAVTDPNAFRNSGAESDAFIANSKIADQEAAAVRQASALLAAQKASDLLATAQENLAGRVGTVNSVIGAQVAPLDAVAQARQALALATGQTTGEQIAEAEALKALEAARKRGAITLTDQVAALKAYKEGNLDVRDVFQIAGDAGKPYLAALEKTGALYQAATEKAKAYAQAEKQNTDLVGEQAANRRVAIVRRVTTETDREGLAANVLDKQKEIDLQKDVTSAIAETAETDAQGYILRADGAGLLADKQKELTQAQKDFATAGETTTSTVVAGYKRQGEAAVEARDKAITAATDQLGVDPTQTRLEFIFDVKDQEELDGALEKLKNAPVETRTKFVIDMLGGAEQLPDILEALKNMPTETQIKAAFDVSGAGDVQQLLDLLGGSDPEGGIRSETSRDIKFNVIAALGATDADDAIDKLSNFTSKDIQFALKILGVEDAQKAADLLSKDFVTVDGKTYAFSVKSDTDKATEDLAAVKEGIEEVKDKTVVIEVDNKVAVENIAAVQSARDNLLDKDITINVEKDAASRALGVFTAELAAVPSLKTVIVKTVFQTEGKPPDVTEKCFAAGTRISIGEGATIPIENIVIGDLVTAFDHFSQVPVRRRVTRLFRHFADMTVMVLLSNGQSIQCTSEHPFCVDPARGVYVAAKDLQQGQALVSVYGDKILVFSVTVAAGAWVYNFEVEDAHNYFAGDVLVHNRSEQLDLKLADVVDSFNRLAVNGRPGALERASVMVTQVLSPLVPQLAGAAGQGGDQILNYQPTIRQEIDQEVAFRRFAKMVSQRRV
jgi:hypothetical protein